MFALALQPRMIESRRWNYIHKGRPWHAAISLEGSPSAIFSHLIPRLLRRGSLCSLGSIHGRQQCLVLNQSVNLFVFRAHLLDIWLLTRNKDSQKVFEPTLISLANISRQTIGFTSTAWSHTMMIANRYYGTRGKRKLQDLLLSGYMPLLKPLSIILKWRECTFLHHGSTQCIVQFWALGGYG